MTSPRDEDEVDEAMATGYLVAVIGAGAALVLLAVLALVTVGRLRGLARETGSLRAATDAGIAPLVASLSQVKAHREAHLALRTIEIN